jgi:hypothetical protein
MNKAEFEAKVRAAVEGNTPDAPTPLEESLRALVGQLGGGPPAPTSGDQRVVRADASDEEPEN